jgi:hypothetical protein
VPSHCFRICGSASLASVDPSRVVNVSAILNAVYRKPENLTQSLSVRVRARLALLDTATELARLLLSAPASAFAASLPAAKPKDESEEGR